MTAVNPATGPAAKPSIITPTVGRVVLFNRAHRDGGSLDKALPAIITHVWSEDCVNVQVFGLPPDECCQASVRLIQPGAPAQVWDGNAYCFWMPFQVGQAAKTDEAERLLRIDVHVLMAEHKHLIDEVLPLMEKRVLELEQDRLMHRLMREAKALHGEDELPLGPGAVVRLRCDNRIEPLLMTVACMHEGLAHVQWHSASGDDIRNCHMLPAVLHVVIAGPPAAAQEPQPTTDKRCDSADAFAHAVSAIEAQAQAGKIACVVAEGRFCCCGACEQKRAEHSKARDHATAVSKPESLTVSSVSSLGGGLGLLFTGGQNFGAALYSLKAGKKVARSGWNGKGMFIEYVPAGPNINAHFLLKGTDGRFSTWVPSVSDCLATDWQVAA